MTEETKTIEFSDGRNKSVNELDLWEMALAVWTGRKLIIWMVIGFTLATIIAALLMKNVYTAQVVIKPVSQTPSSGKLSSLAAQFGSLANMAGIAMPSSTSSTDIANLLKSRVLKKDIIEKYNLLPVLFPDQWDNEKKTWKKPFFNPISFMKRLLPSDPSVPGKEPGVPTIWDGIRELDKNMTVEYDLQNDIVTMTFDFTNPETAVKIINYFVLSLNDRLSSEAKRMALINREYLEKQLRETNDSIVQQKIYNLIAEKIETIMMAEVKEGFAFKILDPPMTPDEKSKPKRALMVATAFVTSLFLGIFIVLFREYLKKMKVKVKAAGGQNA